MICRYCDQWNPDGAVRCCFCHNSPADDQDRTSQASRATLPPQASSASFSTRRTTERASQLESLPLWQLVAGVVGAIVLIIGLKCVIG